MLTTPFFHTLEMTKRIGVLAIMSLMLIPKTAGLLTWNSLMKVFSVLSSILVSFFFEEQITWSRATASITPMIPIG